MIGDSETDIEAGKRVGCRTARLIGSVVMTPTREHANHKEVPPDITAGSLLDAVGQILDLEQIQIRK